MRRRRGEQRKRSSKAKARQDPDLRRAEADEIPSSRVKQETPFTSSTQVHLCHTRLISLPNAVLSEAPLHCPNHEASPVARQPRFVLEDGIRSAVAYDALLQGSDHAGIIWYSNRCENESSYTMLYIDSIDSDTRFT